MKRANIHKVIRAARTRGLYVLSSGDDARLEYKFWDSKTGKWVLSYYPAQKRWLSCRGKDGAADDYRAAIEAVLGPAP